MNVVHIRISDFENYLDKNKEYIVRLFINQTYTSSTLKPNCVCTSRQPTNDVSVVYRKYFSDVLKNAILKFPTFKSMLSTESHVVNKQIILTPQRKASIKYLKVPIMHLIHKLHKKNSILSFHRGLNYYQRIFLSLV